jgi:hypothetical protein
MQQRSRSGPLLGIAGVLAAMASLMFVLAVSAFLDSQWAMVVGASLVGVVASIFAARFYVAWLRLRQRDR